MSFSSEVKDELFGVMPGARHCKIAEIAAVYAILGDRENETGMSIRTENERLARKFFTLLGKAFNIEKDLQISGQMIYEKPCHIRCCSQWNAAGDPTCAEHFLQQDQSAHLKSITIWRLSVPTAMSPRRSGIL